MSKGVQYVQNTKGYRIVTCSVWADQAKDWESEKELSLNEGAISCMYSTDRL
jgi:hypothetical protein